MLSRLSTVFLVFNSDSFSLPASFLCSLTWHEAHTISLPAAIQPNTEKIPRELPGSETGRRLTNRKREASVLRRTEYLLTVVSVILDAGSSILGVGSGGTICMAGTVALSKPV